MRSLYAVIINVSGEIAVFYRWAVNGNVAYWLAIDEASMRYGMNRSKMLSFQHEEKKLATKQ